MDWCNMSGCEAEVRQRLSIPEWFEWWDLDTKWSGFEERIVAHADIVCTDRRVWLYHRNMKCFRIEEVTGYRLVTIWRWGTCCAYLVVRRGALEEEFRLAVEVLRATGSEFRDLMAPDLNGMVDIAVQWGGLGKMVRAVLPPVADGITIYKFSVVLDHLDAIRAKIRELFEVRERLQLHEGQKVCSRNIPESEWQYVDQRWEPTMRMVVGLDEIRCREDLLARPEGLLIEVEGETSYPDPEESEELRELLRDRPDLSDAEYSDLVWHLIMRIAREGGG